MNTPKPTRRFPSLSSTLQKICLALPLLCTAAPAQTRVPLQPLVQQIRQVVTTMAYLGEPLPGKDQKAIDAIAAKTGEAEAVAGLQQILDQYALAVVEINPESRVKVLPGAAKRLLYEGGTRLFLVKVMNQAGVTARLGVQSPNALPVYVQSNGSAEPKSTISPADLRDRWMSVDLYDKNPMSEPFPACRWNTGSWKFIAGTAGSDRLRLALT